MSGLRVWGFKGFNGLRVQGFGVQGPRETPNREPQEHSRNIIGI